jgi:ubiquinone/menaquinone biosynthesis C-methylase UbiE
LNTTSSSHTSLRLSLGFLILQTTMATHEESRYNSIAQSYASYDSFPHAKLEQELVAKAIGNCTGLTVLDLGGGNGQYARKAIELGAELVDVLDISPAMLEVGIEIEAKLGREGKIRWLEADATKALHHLPLMPDGYDIVMCNWLFDHASSDEVSNSSNSH